MNTTEDSVKDEKRKLTAEELGRLQVKTNEIAKRIERGAISYDDALAGMQDVIEGKSKRLRLDLIPQKKWWKANGVICLKVISDGTTGEQWIERLEKKGFKISKYAKELLLSKDFKPTFGVEYTIAVLKGSIFNDTNRVTKRIRDEASARKLTTPSPEVACLIREMFSDEEIKAMGFGWIVTFHKPIKDSDGGLRLLNARLYGDGSWLSARHDSPDDSWLDGSGFAFEVSREKVA